VKYLGNKAFLKKLFQKIVGFKKSMIDLFMIDLISLILSRQDQDKVTFLNKNSHICIFL